MKINKLETSTNIRNNSGQQTDKEFQTVPY